MAQIRDHRNGGAMERQRIETNQTLIPIAGGQGIQHPIPLQNQEEEWKLRQMQSQFCRARATYAQTQL